MGRPAGGLHAKVRCFAHARAPLPPPALHCTALQALTVVGALANMPPGWQAASRKPTAYLMGVITRALRDDAGQA